MLNLSVLDRWWVEACVEGVTGWSALTVLNAIALYGRLQNAYCLATTGSWRNGGGAGAMAIDDERVHRQLRLLFQQHRMVRRYATEVVSPISVGGPRLRKDRKGGRDDADNPCTPCPGRPERASP